MILFRFRNPKRCFSNHALPSLKNPVYALRAHNARLRELARSHSLTKARQIFDEIPHGDYLPWNIAYSRDPRTVSEARDVRTWTTLLSAYASVGRVREARSVFDEMPECNVVSWNAMVSAYAKNGRLEEARAVFDAMPERDVASWNSMLTGYCHASLMAEARELFEEMGERDIASWTVLMSGYVRIGDYAKAWEAFRRMRTDDGLLCPDRPSFVAVVSALTGLGDVKLLESLRTLAIKTGCEADVVLGTATLNAYTRMGELDFAVTFFEAMPEKNGFAWSTVISALARFGRLDEAVELFDRDPDKTVESRTSMLAGYAQNGRIREARSLFDGMPVPGIVSWNAMIAGYAQNGMMGNAMGLFERMPRRNSVSWAVMIAGCAQNGRPGEALRLLSELHGLGAVPSHSCFTSALFACANSGAREMGRQMHALAIKAGAANDNPYIGNGLITMYANCGDHEEARRVFGQMRSRDTVSWNALIACLSQHSMVEEARATFERMPRRDIVSWTSMISAYVQAGTGFEAFQLFQRMLRSGVEPNAPAIMSILSFCSNFGAPKLGLQVHSLVFRLGLDSDVFVGNALVGMYFRCGCVDSFKVFDEMDERDIVTWNSMLSGCAHNGLGREAIHVFQSMKSAGVTPNEASFTGLLGACSHTGLVDEGWRCFKSMESEHGLVPSLGHYACIVDLLGRAGHLYEAEAFIENMPIEPDSIVWAALLGACRVHSDAELGRRVAERLFGMEPEKPGNYILLSNIYASKGMFEEVTEVRRLMRAQGVMKDPGCSTSASSGTRLSIRRRESVTGSLKCG